MNRFELECGVDVRGYRKGRDLMGNVDPLSRRERRKKANALLAKHGRRTKEDLTVGAAVRMMARNGWTTMLVYSVIKTLVDERQSVAAPMSADESDEIGMRERHIQLIYHRARAVGFSHSEATRVMDAYEFPARELRRNGGRVVVRHLPSFTLSEAAEAIVSSRQTA